MNISDKLITIQIWFDKVELISIFGINDRI